MRTVYHYCEKLKKVETFNNCECRNEFSKAPTFGIRNYFDQSLGARITSESQRQKLMRQQKVIDVKDAPSKNPLVLEGADKWKWRKSRGLA